LVDHHQHQKKRKRSEKRERESGEITAVVNKELQWTGGLAAELIREGTEGTSELTGVGPAACMHPEWWGSPPISNHWIG
jgi:hypothetical protein